MPRSRSQLVPHPSLDCSCAESIAPLLSRVSRAESHKVSELYSIPEIAAAADVPVELVVHLAESEQVLVLDGFVRQPDAVALVRKLGVGPGGAGLLSPLRESRRRGGLPLFASGALHVLGAALVLIASSLGLLKADDTETTLAEKPPPVQMVFLMTPGPSGGGGGGGLNMPAPPPRAELKAPVVKKTPSPVPRPRPYRPPPRPVMREVTPPRRPPPLPPPVQAPVVADPGDAQELPGVVEAPPAAAPPPSAGPGTGGGTGSGRGSGVGEGEGSGIGAGSGGGTGGGPFRPGSGVEPPQLLREVRPLYTDEARRRALEGDVVLEIVVRADGSVGDVKVLRSLGGGLDQRAIAAVRQWRFAPARRMGAAVDVVVEVAVGFSLR
jgi:protein TonB